MRIAVVGKCQFSMFSGSQANATVAVAETLKLQGHDVYIVSVGTDALWWDDVNMLKALWQGKVIRFADIKEPFDLAIEVGHHLESAAERATVAKKSVVLFRKHAALDEIEHSLFPTSGTKRCWDGVSEVWAFDAFCNGDDVQILETISRLPVYRVPYVWTPSVNEKHREETQSPLWIQMTNSYLQEKGLTTLPWSFHVAETNTTSASSCTLPVLIMREAVLKKTVEASKFRIHNADHVYKSKFFQDNVWRHARVEDLSGDFVGRQRVVDWVFEPMSCVITHQRFTPFRPMLLDLAWVGIPFIHNSQLVREIGGGLERFYYADNRISEGVECIGRIQEDFAGRVRYFSIEGLNAVRKGIMERLTPYSGVANAGWRAAVDRVLGQATVAVPVAGQATVAAPVPAAPIMFGQAATSLPATAAVPVPVTVVPVATQKQTLTVGFSDMWDSFNPAYNFFTLLLEEAASHLKEPLQIVGKQITESSPPPDILIFGPFGETWTKFPAVPKAHFTGENSAPVSGPNVELNMCFPHADMVKDDYLRLPLWILEIDWFGADPDRIANPKPIPIDLCTKTVVGDRKKFCAFVVSNPNNPLRNAVFQWLTSYKHVDSAGALFNNVGNALAAGPGGGGGELKKLEFLKDYKFCITYENSSGQGYVTEKLLHAKAAGCVPIYWGDPKVNRDFNTKGFIVAQDFKTPGELIDAVRRIDENDELYREMASVAALDDYKLDWTRRTLSFCAGRLLAIGLRKEVELPRFLGARSSEEAAQRRALRSGPVVSPAVSPAVTPAVSPEKKGIELPLLVTFVTRRFLPSLQLWLTAADAQYKSMKSLTARVYYGSDVPQDTLKKLTDTFKFVEICPIPSEAPADFPDLWEPQHFAWKIWIYKTVVAEPALAGRMVLYMDAGCFMCRWPSTWLQKAQEENICFLEDPRQTNGQWCHAEFCRQLAVTDSEKAGKQIVAGILAFRAGAEKPSTLFYAAWNLAQKRSVIVGEKWTATSGGVQGHRHDQSILSILSQRQGTSRFPLDDVYADKSLRHTHQTNRSIYCHRGGFQLNASFSEGIDDCYIINLDRREDRMDRLYQTTPELKDRATRFSAIEGKKLELTPTLARLFRPHDFMWKKAIMGCALSHLSLWWKLYTEHQDINTFLILEDDVKLKPEWEMRWKAAQPHLPEDWDIVYLGGILPPNRAAFEHSKERVNEHFSRVANNNIFGQSPPNRYFHWCAYAYVLSRRGAQKVLEVMAGHDGYWTSADHMLCNPINHIRMYFLDPLVAGCYQDEDPKYANSAFNDFNRVDSFDSDLWNNDERFSKEEVEKRLAEMKDKEMDIARALKEAREMMTVAVPVPAATPAAKAHAVTQSITQPPTNFKHRLLCLEGMNLDISKLHEKEWLYELLGKPTALPVESVSMDAPPPLSGQTPILIVMRPWPHKYNVLLQRWSSLGAKFYVLHLSDEHGTDDLSFYDFPGCLKVVRMYDRSDLTKEQRAKCVIVPLGYHWTLRGGGCPMPLERTPRLPFRNTRWSFFGTNWKNRDQKLAPIMGFGPNRCKLLEGWNATDMVGYDEYIGTLLDTVFVPCPGGQNAETFRYYEALECGCIPIVVREPGDELFVKYITSNMPILPVNSWTEAAGLMNQLYADKSLLENYRTNLLIGWRIWKERLVAEVAAAFQLS